jgi:hypothetical protein
MDKCPWYQVKVLNFRSREVHGHQQSVGGSEVLVAWCSHKHSPMPERSTGLVAAANVLTCEGNLRERCQVPSDKLHDV